MGSLIVSMSMSLDGFVAGANAGPDNGLGDGGEVLHSWLNAGNIDPTSYRPERGVNARIFDEMLTTGAVVVDRHTFEWADEWGGDHHDGVPVFVVTRTPPAVSAYEIVSYVDDPVTAIDRAKAAAGERDVMMHGVGAVRDAMRAGAVDEFSIALVPVLLGRGRRLFDEGDTAAFELTRAEQGEGVLHLRYRVRR